jgi:hypothetical protein
MHAEDDTGGITWIKIVRNGIYVKYAILATK